MQDYVGVQIERYRITERLGMGGMAVVYKAFDTQLERDVAIKIIRTEAIPPAQYERLMKRFEREAKSQAKFSHPNIVPVYDYGEWQGAPYLVMEYVSGGTLKLKTGQAVRVGQALQWLIPIADALSYAHQQDVVHRDIKPSNILFDRQGRTHLADFGVAKVLDTTEPSLTGTGMGVGTPAYMAPEQWKGKTSEASDQYALATVLYELITGQKPYAADTPAAVAIMQATEPLKPPSKLVKGIPEAVEKVLYKALALKPQDRYTDMAAFHKVLVALGEEAAIRPSVAGVMPSASAMGEVLSGAGASHVDEGAQPKVSAGIGDVVTQPVGEKVPKWIFFVGIALILGIGAIIILVFGGLALFKRIGREEPEEAVAVLETDEGSQQTQSPQRLTSTTTSSTKPAATNTAAITRTSTVKPTITHTAIPIVENLNEADGAEIVFVPAGEFLMGSDPEDDPYFWGAEGPAHDVYVDAFWIYKTEVTNAMYQACVDVQACPRPLRLESRTVEDYYTNPNYADYPVIQVNWVDAVSYCKWVGGRLPTEAEWEKAARGTDGRLFPWGDGNLQANSASYCGSSCPGEEREGTHDGYYEIAPVGMFPAGASPYGALDMAGNVWEWVSDYFDSQYYVTLPYDNPLGPLNGSRHVIRGGSWFNPSSGLRTVARTSMPTNDGLDTLGFRCVVEDGE